MSITRARSLKNVIYVVIFYQCLEKCLLKKIARTNCGPRFSPFINYYTEKQTKYEFLTKKTSSFLRFRCAAP